MTVIDIHTHMIPREWLDLLQRDGGDYELKPTRAGHMAIHLAGAPFVTLMPEMFDYDLRLRAMDEAGVDMAVLSLTGPNVFWGTRETSVKAARIGNAAYAESQRKYPDRIRWVASIPWEYPDDALAELARARADGALGRRGACQHPRPRPDRSAVRAGLGRDRPAGSAGVRSSDHSAGRQGHAARRIQPGHADRLHGRHHALLRAADPVGLSRPLSQRQADRAAWRRHAALSQRAARPTVYETIPALPRRRSRRRPADSRGFLRHVVYEPALELCGSRGADNVPTARTFRTTSAT